MSIDPQTSLQSQLAAHAWHNDTVPVTATIDIDRPLIVDGCFLTGWLPAATAHPARVTFNVLHDDGPAVILQGPTAGVIGCVFRYPRQDRSNPRPYPPTIHATTGGVTVRHCVFQGSYQMMQLDKAGHDVIDDIWGQVLNVGIEASNADDVTRFSHIHLWPNWSMDALPFAYNPPGNASGAAAGMVLRGLDWAHLDDVFVFGCRTAVQVLPGRGGRGCGFRAGTIDIDACSVGLDVRAIGQDGISIANLTMAGNTHYGAEPLTGILMDAPDGGHMVVTAAHYHGNIGQQVAYLRSSPDKLRMISVIRETF
ncbi:MAG: hypothetical protein KDI12_03640 [Anaerolineae bacterium]|nr:hypothetical protein [Anaerolineae bacterium]